MKGQKTYRVTLTKEEIENIKSALNFYSVERLHPNMDNAKDEYEAKFWYEEWSNNLDIFCKLHEKVEK